MDDLSAHMTKEEAEQYERFFEQVIYYLGNCSVVEKLLHSLPFARQGKAKLVSCLCSDLIIS